MNSWCSGPWILWIDDSGSSIAGSAKDGQEHEQVRCGHDSIAVQIGEGPKLAKRTEQQQQVAGGTGKVVVEIGEAIRGLPNFMSCIDGQVVVGGDVP